jgi:hypothetical protein
MWSIRINSVIFLCLALFGCTSTGFLPTIVSQIPIKTEQPTQNEFLPQIRRLMDVQTDCKLPCFWTLIPGQSTRDEVAQLIKTIDRNNFIQDQVDVSEISNFALFFDPVGLLSVNLSTHDSVLQKIRIGLASPYIWLNEHIFEIPQVLNALGQPDDVFILVAGPPLGYTLTVVYNSAGVMVRYRADFSDNEQITLDSPLQLCLSQDEIYQIDVWIQNIDDELVENNLPDLRDENRDMRPYWTLEHLAGYSVSDFAQAFEDHKSCIRLPTLRELKAMGYQY